MKFYSTILLVVLSVPGLSECEGCTEFDQAMCDNAKAERAAAYQSYEAAKEAYFEAKEAGADEWTLDDLQNDMDTKFGAIFDAGQAIVTFCE